MDFNGLIVFSRNLRAKFETTMDFNSRLAVRFHEKNCAPNDKEAA
jgi:hypothetical protein